MIFLFSTAKKLGYTGAVALGEALNSHTKLTELNMWSLLPIFDVTNHVMILDFFHNI